MFSLTIENFAMQRASIARLRSATRTSASRLAGAVANFCARDDYADADDDADDDDSALCCCYDCVVAIDDARANDKDDRVPCPSFQNYHYPRRCGSFCLLFPPKQVRGPVREVEQSEYEGEGDPRDDVYALGPRRELGQPRPAAVFFRWLHVYFALPLIHRHRILPVSDERLLKEIYGSWFVRFWNTMDRINK